MSAPRLLVLDEERAFEDALTPAPDDPSVRRERECRALQAAWAERAACHERLTRAGAPPGPLLERLEWVIAQWQMTRGGL